MKSRTRSFVGITLMFLIIPIIAGLLACMPVPIGDPERSRIDPDISGVWIMEEEDGEAALYLFRPYDKRTWLVVSTGIESGAGANIVNLNVETAGELLALLDRYPVGDDGITASSPSAYKAWLTRLGGEQFMAWEPVGGIRDDGTFEPDFWFVFKIVKPSSDRFELQLLDPEYEGFEHIIKPDEYEGNDYPGEMRRVWERAIKRYVNDEQLYSEGLAFRRLPDDRIKKAAELFREAIAFE